MRDIGHLENLGIWVWACEICGDLCKATRSIKCLFVFILLSACVGDGINSKEHYVEKIKLLESTEQKQEYLESIFKADQDIRNDSDIILKYGYGSQEHKDHFEKMRTEDEANYKKIEIYLKEYGYPSIITMSEIAVITPWVVIHHSSVDNARRRNFPFLFDAYKKGDLDEGSFSMYLDRWYKMEFNERLDMDSSYNEVDKITLMIDALGLSS